MDEIATLIFDQLRTEGSTVTLPASGIVALKAALRSAGGSGRLREARDEVYTVIGMLARDPAAEAAGRSLIGLMRELAQEIAETLGEDAGGMLARAGAASQAFQKLTGGEMPKRPQRIGGRPPVGSVSSGALISGLPRRIR